MESPRFSSDCPVSVPLIFNKGEFFRHLHGLRYLKHLYSTFEGLILSFEYPDSIDNIAGTSIEHHAADNADKFSPTEYFYHEELNQLNESG